MASAAVADESDLSEAFKRKLAGTLTCMVCGPLHRFPSGKTHKSRTKHEMRAMTPEERAEEIQWYREIRADGETARLKILDQRRAAAKKILASGASSSAVEGEAVVPAMTSNEYVFDFGKHRGKTLSFVWRTQQSYLCYLMNQTGFLDAHLTLKRAMESAGIMDDATQRAAAMRRETARKTVARAAAEDASGVQMHPEVAKLRRIQLMDARQVLEDTPLEEFDDAPTEGLVVPVQLRKSRRAQIPRKKAPSCGLRRLQHCWICGAIEHKTGTCPDKPEEVRLRAKEQQLRAQTLFVNRRRAALVTHLKYVALHQRTPSYEQRALHSAAVKPARTFKELLRMNAYDFVKAQISDELFADLQGAPCTQPGCYSGSVVEDRPRTLGRLSRPKRRRGMDVTRNSVCYRCQRCRSPFAVTYGSVLFSRLGGGAASFTDNVLAFFNSVHDISVTATCKQLGLSEPVVRRFYDTARAIMEAGALRLQALLVFGRLADNKAADIECDEAQFFKWSEECEDGERDYHYYVWLGVRQRGSPDKFYLEDLGVKTSHGEGRLPPLSPAVWHEVCSRIFKADSNLVQMSDSAVAYTRRPWGLGIVDAHSVNHSRKPTPELARSVEALADVSTGEKRAAICSTNLIDPTWGKMKSSIPDGGVTGKTPQGRQRLASYIRMAQWKIMHSTYDRWGPFCREAALYERGLLAAKTKQLTPLGPTAVQKRAKLQKQMRGEVMQAKRLNPVQDDAAAEPVADVLALADAETPSGERKSMLWPLGEHQRSPEPQRKTADEELQLRSEAACTTADEELQLRSEAAWGDRYFATQAAGGQCGKHALNNILGNPVMTELCLEAACQEVLADFGPDEPASLHRRGHGWYSHSILAKVLNSTVPPMWRLALGPAEPEQWGALVADPAICGVLCNIRNVHWTCITKHNGHVFYVDSLTGPVVIGQPDFVSILSHHPMSFLVVKHDSAY